MSTSIDDLWIASRRAKRLGYDPFVLSIGKKKRVISAPRTWLKELQSSLYENVLLQLPVSESTYCVRGKNVVLSAQQHIDKKHMVVLDIKDCFPSISHSAVSSSFEEMGATVNVATLMTRLVTNKGVLPQGPPSSPQVLNLVLKEADHDLLALCNEFSATYTRYMDDLCFSADGSLVSLIKPATAILARYGFQVNLKKRRVWGPDDPHTVTKIVVNSGLHPNPDYLESLVHSIEQAGARDLGISTPQLLGKIAWVSQLDSELGSRLRSMLNAELRQPPPRRASKPNDRRR